MDWRKKFPSIIKTDWQKIKRGSDLYRTILRKLRLAEMSEGKCAYCGAQMRWVLSQYKKKLPEDAITIDHVIPRKKFKWFKSHGYKPAENLVACCNKCNNQKGDKIYMEEWMPE